MNRDDSLLDPPDGRPRWRGVNHLALITTDMDATVRFYHGVLGARLVSTIGTPAFRHYFFEIGAENTIAFFEYHNFFGDFVGDFFGDDRVEVAAFAKAAGVPDPRAVQFDHLSLNLPDEDALRSLQRRLKAAGCEVTDVVDHDVLRSIYFTDPDGIALEASWWTVDATGRPADYQDERLFADPDPVAAVRELATDGRVSWVPQTRLT